MYLAEIRQQFAPSNLACSDGGDGDEPAATADLGRRLLGGGAEAALFLTEGGLVGREMVFPPMVDVAFTTNLKSQRGAVRVTLWGTGKGVAMTDCDCHCIRLTFTARSL